MESKTVKDTLADIRIRFREVNKLLNNRYKDSNLSNESEPYKIQYEAIEALKAVETDLVNVLAELSEEQKGEEEIMLAVVHVNLGLLHVDTEETKAGEEQFMKCLKLLENKELESDAILPVLGALNQLGLLWFQWNEPEKAKSFLEQSERFYNDFKKTDRTCEGPSNICFGTEITIGELSAKEILERVHTLTLYYLAQTYTSLKDHRKAAIYCYMTLRRQLGNNKIIEDLDSIDWALNAASLSQYFIQHGAFSQARYHLAAASYILQRYKNMLTQKKAENTEDSEALEAEIECSKRRSADIAKCWAKYGILLLSQSKQRLLQKSESEEENVQSDKDSMGLKMIDDLKFDVLETEIEPIANQVTDKYLLTFDDARLVFLNVQKWLNEVKTYYTLEDHASDYVLVIQDMSHAYKYLAFFEEQEERQAKMHKRRINILENVVKELNPQYYGTACRQIWMELGETYSEILDIKFNRLRESNEKSTPQALTKTNNLAKSAIKNFQAFLDSLETRNSSSEMKPFSEDVEQAALKAYFNIGRLYNKIITLDKTIMLENVQNSVNAYKFIIDYCEKYPKAAESMKVELNLCKELVTLLPSKINRLRKSVTD